jgi:putative transposase
MEVLVTMRLMTVEAGDSKRWQRVARRPTTSESTGSCRLMRAMRAMQAHGLLFYRHAGGVERRHDVASPWVSGTVGGCSYGFDVDCDNGEKVRVAFAHDRCDREAMSFLPTTGGITGEDESDSCWRLSTASA